MSTQFIYTYTDSCTNIYRHIDKKTVKRMATHHFAQNIVIFPFSSFFQVMAYILRGL